MTDRSATPASAGPAPRPELPWEQPDPAPPLVAQPDLPCRAEDRGGLTPSDVPTPLPVAAIYLSPADRLLAADPDRLPAYSPAPLADPDRSPAEAHALSAALGCPDLFLADADPGPDQQRFAADLAAEAARAGRRVLVVAPTSADADAVLARLTDGPGPLVGRALAGYEHPDRLPAAAAARTARAHRDALLADARAGAAARVADAETRLTALRAAAEAVAPARAAAGRLAELTAEEARLTRDQVGRQQTLTGSHAAALARFDEESQKLAAELEAARKELAALRDHAASAGKRAGGVLGLFKGIFSHKPAADEPDREKAVEQTVGRLEAEVARVAVERAHVDEKYRAGRDLMPGGEAEDRVTEVGRERARIEADFRRDALALIAAGLGQAEMTPEAVDRTAATIPAQIRRAEAELEAARRSAAEPGSPASALRVLGRVRVVVATFAAVGADPLTLPPDGTGPAFDLLVLTDADRLNETEFAHAARSAARWVLVGDAVGPHRRGRPGLFRRLWGHLHREAWAHEAGRLVALLADAHPDRLICEPLADRPEVELRFARGPGGEPLLAEVAFPPTVPAAAAKTFLADELGEVRLSPCGPLHWHELDDRLTACWPAADAADADWADLAPGVREKVVGTGADCRTAAVSFERSAGWDRDAAERWLADHTGPGPRTAVLPRPTVIASAPARVAAGVSG